MDGQEQFAGIGGDGNANPNPNANAMLGGGAVLVGNGVGIAPVGWQGVAGPMPVFIGPPATAPAPGWVPEPGWAANLNPTPFVQQMPAFPPAANFNQLPLPPFGWPFGAPPTLVRFNALPPQPPIAQFNGLTTLPPRRGLFAPVVGPVRFPYPVADDTLRLDLCELFQRFPTPRRRRGFTQGMLLTDLLNTIT